MLCHPVLSQITMKDESGVEAREFKLQYRESKIVIIDQSYIFLSNSQKISTPKCITSGEGR